MKIVLASVAVISGIFALLTLIDSLAALAIPLMLGLVLFDVYIAFFAERERRGRREPR